MQRRLSFSKITSIALLGLLLASCASVPRPAPVAVPASPAPAASPSPAQSAPPPGWESVALTLGAWLYRPDAELPAALFGQAGGPAALVVRCVRAQGQIHIQRAIGGPLSALNALQIQTTSRTVTLRAAARPSTALYMTVELPAADPFLDAIAFSRGRWRVGVATMPDLIMPRAAEVARVIEECRAVRTGSGAGASGLGPKL